MRLIKKLAERIDGVDLRGLEPGDTVDLTQSEARLLLAERWAVREGRRQYVSADAHSGEPAPAAAADQPKRSHGSV